MPYLSSPFSLDLVISHLNHLPPTKLQVAYVWKKFFVRIQKQLCRCQIRARLFLNVACIYIGTEKPEYRLLYVRTEPKRIMDGATNSEHALCCRGNHLVGRILTGKKMSLSKLSSPSSSTFIDYSMPIGTWVRVRVTGTEFYMDAQRGCGILRML